MTKKEAKKIIKQFIIETTDNDIEILKNQERITGYDFCFVCGIKSKELENLKKALKKLNYD